MNVFRIPEGDKLKFAVKNGGMPKTRFHDGLKFSWVTWVGEYGICRWHVTRDASNTDKNPIQIQDDFAEVEEGTKSAQYNSSKVEILGSNYLGQCIGKRQFCRKKEHSCQVNTC